MSEELKQCPFCGGKAKATHGVIGVTNNTKQVKI